MINEERISLDSIGSYLEEYKKKHVLERRGGMGIMAFGIVAMLYGAALEIPYRQLEAIDQRLGNEWALTLSLNQRAELGEAVIRANRSVSLGFQEDRNQYIDSQLPGFRSAFKASESIMVDSLGGGAGNALFGLFLTALNTSVPASLKNWFRRGYRRREAYDLPGTPPLLTPGKYDIL